MTSTANAGATDLRAVLSTAEIEAQRLLHTDDVPPLDAVVWLSAHLAAMERAVYPVVRRKAPGGKAIVAKQHDVVTQLVKVLRATERHHSGDVLASGLSRTRMADMLSVLIDEHLEVESELFDGLDAELSGAEQIALIGAYERALEHAPTRPHPHFHRGAVMFKLDALRDRVLDTMDGRHVPVPRLARHTITPGRWGAYLLGQQHDAD